ncbi:endonuclease III domain-containing protein [Candidatus Latescibacterota bacterium]
MVHDIDKIIKLLHTETAKWRKPVVTEMVQKTRDPFQVLISTVLSLRTKDEVTREASKRLFKLAKTPKKMLALNKKTIEKAIYPVGFYRNKTRTILEICRTLMEKYDGKVPDDLDELLSFKGVGRKTANLVLTLGYNKEGICVDTHVHRISNRLGYVSTRTAKETEFALMEKLPTQYWIELNDLLVSFGQNTCKPISPLCSQCPIHDHCMRTGVTIHR